MPHSMIPKITRRQNNAERIKIMLLLSNDIVIKNIFFFKNNSGFFQVNDFAIIVSTFVYNHLPPS